jgi:SAM-dependent methyltransferase
LDRWLPKTKTRFPLPDMQIPENPDSKLNEINYLDNLSKVRGIPPGNVQTYHLAKPFIDARRGWYIMDLGQIMKLLPDPPARLLDLGIGSGWTSKYLALSGYQVVGLDIAEDMIKLAKINCQDLKNIDLYTCDYESEINFGAFDCALIYDALHHASDESRVIQNVHRSLKKGGRLVTAEPGRGHSQSENTRAVVQDFGVTEKDMEFSLQKRLMHEAGFSEIRQYYRLSELGLEDVSSAGGRARQIDKFTDFYAYTLEAGLTSIVVAMK